LPVVIGRSGAGPFTTVGFGVVSGPPPFTIEQFERGEQCATLHGFIEEFWYVLEPVAKFRTGWALQAMCAHLEAVHDGRIQNLLITVPPGMMKSLLVSVFFQAWEWGPKDRPDLRYLATSYSEANVLRDSNKVRKLVESEKYGLGRTRSETPGLRADLRVGRSGWIPDARAAP
jgi:hypothetical protein